VGGYLLGSRELCWGRFRREILRAISSGFSTRVTLPIKRNSQKSQPEKTDESDDTTQTKALGLFEYTPSPIEEDRQVDSSRLGCISIIRDEPWLGAAAERPTMRWLPTSKVSRSPRLSGVMRIQVLLACPSGPAKFFNVGQRTLPRRYVATAMPCHL